MKYINLMKEQRKKGKPAKFRRTERQDEAQAEAGPIRKQCGHGRRSTDDPVGRHILVCRNHSLPDRVFLFQSRG